MTAVLGISAFYHDSAAALVVDGDIVAAAQEERFSRHKYDARFPREAIAYCLREGSLEPEQLDYIAFYDKPVVKFERLLETYLAYAPAGFRSFSTAMPAFLKQKLFARRVIRQALDGALRAPVVFPSHHESHAASAFFPSPFDEAAILTLDGVGEWTTASFGRGSNRTIQLLRQLRFPHSLGLLYSAFTYYCGFSVNSGEFKLMGLAPYGRPVYASRIQEHLLDMKPDGSVWLDMEYFRYPYGLTMTSPRFHALFGGPPRLADAPLEQRHMDLAASVQQVTEQCVLLMGRHVHAETGLSNLVMAGGVALNCVANGRLLREGPFEHIWAQPAAGDAGGALGAALFVAHQLKGTERRATAVDRQKASYLGPAYSSVDVEAVLRRHRAHYTRVDDEEHLLDDVAQLLEHGNTVGWFHGRSEFGPRALGARSILADPRRGSMQSLLNRKIKFREGFRPFAPSVLRDRAHEWFDVRQNEDSPYMLIVAPIRDARRLPLSPSDAATLAVHPDLSERLRVQRSSVPAVTHVDFSARLQTVDERHGRFHRLLNRFYERTGCPMLVNTSFNLSWEPIVESPEQAYHSFMQSEMDVLVLEGCIVRKNEQPLGIRLRDTVSDPQMVDAPSPWADPVTGDALVVSATSAVNARTGAQYEVSGGIPKLFGPSDLREPDGHDGTETVEASYEGTPFPDYEDIDTPRALAERARSGVFARLLNEQIPYDARVVEVGCGTGQLTNFLAIAHRSVLGVDPVVDSLRLAEAFRAKHGLVRAAFAQMNLFRPALRRDFFDIVIGNGVLHHTSDCRAAYGVLAGLVRPGGYLVVRLYNRYGRSLLSARRALYRTTGLTSRWLGPQVGRITASAKREASLSGQYLRPHETAFTLDEVLAWVDHFGLEFTNTIPKPWPAPPLREDERLFAPRERGSVASRVAGQVTALRNGYDEGGCFIVIARRPVRARP